MKTGHYLKHDIQNLNLYICIYNVIYICHMYVIYLYEIQVLSVKTGHFLKPVKSCIHGVQIQSNPPWHSAPEFIYIYIHIMSCVYVICICHIFVWDSGVICEDGSLLIFFLKEVKSCICGVQIQSDPPRHSAPEFHVHIRVICMTRVWYSRIITHIEICTWYDIHIYNVMYISHMCHTCKWHTGVCHSNIYMSQKYIYIYNVMYISHMCHTCIWHTGVCHRNIYMSQKYMYIYNVMYISHICVIYACDIKVYVTAIYTCHRNIYTYIMSCIHRIYVSYMHISYRCMCMRGWYM